MDSNTYTGLDMAGAQFNNVSLQSARFHDINLQNSEFEDVNLAEVKFRDVNLSGASIDDCCISGLTIRGVEIEPLLAGAQECRSGELGDITAPPSSAPNPMQAGAIGWVDLTVKEADHLRDFYRAVVGWTVTELEGDFCMHRADSEDPVAGICFAQGVNAEMPPHWMIYITVANLDASVEESRLRGATLLVDRRRKGGAGFCVIRDPAGAVAALYQPEALQPNADSSP